MDTWVLTLTPWGPDILSARREASIYIFLDNHTNTALVQKKFSVILSSPQSQYLPPSHPNSAKGSQSNSLNSPPLGRLESACLYIYA